MSKTILVVDDEPDMLQLLRRTLKKDMDCIVETADSGKAALDLLAQNRFDLVLADIKMPGMDGFALLDVIKRELPGITVVMMTAFGHIEMAVKAMKHGAYDFITKPFDHDALILRLEKALERSRLMRENQRLQRECRDNNVFQNIVGKSSTMQQVYETIQTVAQSDLTVLITGESGTGKDLTARAVHALSHRAQGPFVAVNCPTLPENILESELFGYKKGAFTHATQNKIGLFQEASGGSILLDEIGDISPTIQTKLLRVLQEKEIKPLGDTKTVRVNVRIIASTNQDLKAKIKDGTFREDFFYRLNVLPIILPPLRAHREDIPLIADHLMAKHCAEMNKSLKSISAELMDLLVSYPWEGNVREMENLITRGILFARGKEITPRDVGWNDHSVTQMPTETDVHHHRPYKEAKEETLKRFNARYIGRLLTQNNGNVTQAAKRCGMERQALQQIMRRYAIIAEDYR